MQDNTYKQAQDVDRGGREKGTVLPGSSHPLCATLNAMANTSVVDTLPVFSVLQVMAVERTAARFVQLLGILGIGFEVERTFYLVRSENPWLRGVSLNEFTAEILTPGSFRKLSA